MIDLIKMYFYFIIIFAFIFICVIVYYISTTHKKIEENQYIELKDNDSEYDGIYTLYKYKNKKV